MSEIQVFRFPDGDQPVRTVMRGGEPWFVGRDACDVLGISKPENSLALLDEDERGTHTVGTLGGRQAVTVISEAGLYSLILRSRRQEARAFKRWITHEVLPALRQTGRYELPSLSDPLAELERQTQLTARAIEIAKTERARAVAAESRVAELEPDAARAQRTLDAHGLALVGTVAKRFGIKERALRDFLYAEGLLIRGGARHNEPPARYIQSGHFDLKSSLIEADPDRPPVARSTTYVTPKGEALIWKRLYEAGYVRSPRPPDRQLQLIEVQP